MIYLIIYLTSILLSWISLRVMYSPKGYLGVSKAKPDIADIMTVLIPVVNSICFVVTLVFNISYFIEKNLLKFRYKDHSNFFKIKNK